MVTVKLSDLLPGEVMRRTDTTGDGYSDKQLKEMATQIALEFMTKQNTHGGAPTLESELMDVPVMVHIHVSVAVDYVRRVVRDGAPLFEQQPTTRKGKTTDGKGSK